MQQRTDARVSKTRPRGSLPAAGNRTTDGLEGVLTGDTVAAQTFNLEELAIGHKVNLAQLGKVMKTLANPVVIGVVDRDLGAQS